MYLRALISHSFPNDEKNRREGQTSGDFLLVQNPEDVS